LKWFYQVHFWGWASEVDLIKPLHLSRMGTHTILLRLYAPKVNFYVLFLRPCNQKVSFYLMFLRFCRPKVNVAGQLKWYYQVHFWGWASEVDLIKPLQLSRMGTHTMPLRLYLPKVNFYLMF